ncbi:MAG: glycoside hydrolase family 9 protein [Opitutaceae bacterium]|nr:glycoside hydrolase family 9 protein [Opitutaceae bacterium]
MRLPLPLAVCAALAPLMGTSHAADVIDIRPLTSQILMVHFDEGFISHHRVGHPRSAETALVDPLPEKLADLPTSYRLLSGTDVNFREGRTPLQTWRKSKGTDFAWKNADEHGDPLWAREHWVYLTLPAPLEEGGSYSLEMKGVASNGEAFKFQYRAASSRSDALHVNAIGYTPQAPAKVGYLSHWAGSGGPLPVDEWVGKPFHLVRDGSLDIVFTGELQLRARRDLVETGIRQDTPGGNFSATDVVEADFSSFSAPGVYRLVVPGIGCSHQFRIAADVYRQVFRPVARALYHNRSGIALTEAYTEFTRPAPHNPKLTPGFEGQLFYTSVRSMDWPNGEGSSKDAELLRANIKGPIETSGWYQDAGDWDSYHDHLRVAQELLFAIEVAPKAFTDGELNIPESGNGIPDLLDEAAWLPRFCYRLRNELMAKGYGTGGIGLRICGDPFAFDVPPNGRTVGSWGDVHRPYVASGEDPWSTYRYAGAAAHLAFVLQKLGLADPEGVDWVKEARESYEWAEKNRKPEDETREPVYWLPALRDQRMYATANLYRVTGDTAYLQRFEGDFAAVPEVIKFEALGAEARKAGVSLEERGYTLAGEAAYGPWSLALGGGLSPAPEALVNRVRDAVLFSAWRIGPQAADHRAFRFGGLWHFEMLVGHQTTPYALAPIIGERLTRENDPEKARAFRAAVHTTADYYLGANPLNMVWVSGVGPTNPVHVFHMDAWYNGKPTIHPGLIPYGPWTKVDARTDDATQRGWAYQTLYPADINVWPGAEQWFDQRSCPLTNEFTIHQNIGPAAAVYAWLCDEPSR